MEDVNTSTELVSKITIPASTVTPAATTPHPTSEICIQVCIPPVSAADDETLVATLSDIVNAVYIETESDLFVSGYQRTQSSDIADFIRSGQLAVAYLAPQDKQLVLSSPEVPIQADQVVGCISIKCASPTLGEFGMLALDPAHRGGGNGRKLVQFAEKHCRAMGCSVMQLGILVPKTFHHAFKARLLEWYVRMGYELVSLGDFVQDYPIIAAFLAGPTDYRIFHKKLA